MRGLLPLVPTVCQEALCDLRMQVVSGTKTDRIIVHNYSVSLFPLRAILLVHCQAADKLEVSVFLNILFIYF